MKEEQYNGWIRNKQDHRGLLWGDVSQVQWFLAEPHPCGGLGSTMLCSMEVCVEDTHLYIRRKRVQKDLFALEKDQVLILQMTGSLKREQIRNRREARKHIWVGVLPLSEAFVDPTPSTNEWEHKPRPLVWPPLGLSAPWQEWRSWLPS